MRDPASRISVALPVYDVSHPSENISPMRSYLYSGRPDRDSDKHRFLQVCCGNGRYLDDGGPLSGKNAVSKSESIVDTRRPAP